MVQNVSLALKNFYIARARLSACVVFLFAIVILSDSTALIAAPAATPKKTESASLKRLRQNQDLAKQKPSEAEVSLMTTLQFDTDPMIRQGAAQMLGNFSQNPAVVRVLANALRDDKEKAVRYACALSLGLSPTFKAISALEKAAEDPDADLRRQVAFSLQRHRTGRNKVKAEQILKQLQRDNDASVREMAGAKR